MLAMQGFFHSLGVDERKPSKPFEAGTTTSPVPSAADTGGVSLAPPVSYTEVPVVETRPHETIAADPAQKMTGPQEPLNFTLPTNVDHDGAIVEAATSRVQALGESLTEDEVVAFLRAAGAPEAWIPDLVTISWCESKHRPGAIGDGGNSLGALQMWTGWFRPGEDPFDPLTNYRVGVRVRELRGSFGGGGGWTCATLLNIP